MTRMTDEECTASTATEFVARPSPSSVSIAGCPDWPGLGVSRLPCKQGLHALRGSADQEGEAGPSSSLVAPSVCTLDDQETNGKDRHEQPKSILPDSGVH